MPVTAHELKLRFGHYLEAVRHGQTLCITWRGQALAELRPLAPTAEEALTQLTTQGLATPGTGKLPPYTPAAAKRSAAALILAARDTGVA